MKRIYILFLLYLGFPLNVLGQQLPAPCPSGAKCYETTERISSEVFTFDSHKEHGIRIITSNSNEWAVTVEAISVRDAGIKYQSGAGVPCYHSYTDPLYLYGAAVNNNNIQQDKFVANNLRGSGSGSLKLVSDFRAHFYQLCFDRKQSTTANIKMTSNNAFALYASHNQQDNNGFLSFRDTKMDVKIRLVIEGNLALEDIKEIRIPGIKKINFFQTDFIDFYPDNEDMTVMYHRGNWKESPENTKASTDAVFNTSSSLPRFEIDVSMTEDDIIVATHDQVLQKLLQRMVNNSQFNATYTPEKFNYKKNTIHGMTLDQLKSYNNNQPYVYDRYNKSIIHDDNKLWIEEEIFTYLKNKKNSDINFVVGFDLIVKPDYMKDDQKTEAEIENEAQAKIRRLFKKLVRLVTENDLNDRVLFKFKGMLAHDDKVWDEIRRTLINSDPDKTDGITPQIRYMPIVGKSFGTDAQVASYIDDWKNEIMGNKSHPYLYIDHFELWGNPFDDYEYQTWYKDLISELKNFNPKFKFARFELASSASFGVWSDAEEFAFPETKGKPFNSIASLYNEGYNLLISDYPAMTTNFNDRAISRTLPNILAGDVKKNLTFSDISNAEIGFVLPFIIDKSILTNNTKQAFAQLTNTDGSKPVWEFGIDANNEFYVHTIFKDKTGSQELIYNYLNPIWSPRETGNFSEFNNNDKIFVAILQNKYYYNIFVGTPDGRFDNISFAYGFQNTALIDPNVWNDTSSNLEKQLIASNASGINHSLPLIDSNCHSDIFHFAFENYFAHSSFMNVGHDYTNFDMTSDGVTWPEYEADKEHKIYSTLFDPTNRFLNIPGKDKDRKVNNDDKDVYGSCSYYQNYFSLTDGLSKNANTKGNFEGEVIEEINDNLFQQASVYPNPTQGNVFNLSFNAESKGLYTIKIADNQGRIIDSDYVTIRDLGQQVFTYRSNLFLKPGIYLIMLSNQNKSQTFKLIINKK